MNKIPKICVRGFLKKKLWGSICLNFWVFMNPCSESHHQSEEGEEQMMMVEEEAL
jgi:hypothetical protein